MKRIVSLLIGLLFPAVVTSWVEAADRPPNIVLIVSDDQGWRDARCLGREDIITPNLDRIAREGVRATSCEVPKVRCGKGACACRSWRAGRAGFRPTR